MVYYVYPSRRMNKKYDVYKNDVFILSFGDVRYQHYHDKLGHYKHLDHWDPQRRKNYLKRSRGLGNIHNPNSANYWSRTMLW